MVGPLRPTPCSRRWRSSWIAEICLGSRPMHIGPSTVSMAARVAGKIRWPNDSPQPLTPASVSTRTSSTSMLVTARSRSFGVAPSMTIGRLTTSVSTRVIFMASVCYTAGGMGGGTRPRSFFTSLLGVMARSPTRGLRTTRRSWTTSGTPRSATAYNQPRSPPWEVRRTRSVPVQVRRLGVRRFDRPDDPTATLVGEVHLHQLALSQLVEYLGVGGAKAQAAAQRDHVLGTVDRADGADRLAAVVDVRRVGIRDTAHERDERDHREREDRVRRAHARSSSLPGGRAGTALPPPGVAHAAWVAIARV